MPAIIESSFIAGSVIAGVLLGGLYFGGLWWTVNRMPRASQPLNLYFASLIGRLAVLLVAFYGVLTYFGWLHLLGCLIGFLAARFVLTRRLGPATDAPPREAL